MDNINIADTAEYPKGSLLILVSVYTAHDGAQKLIAKAIIFRIYGDNRINNRPPSKKPKAGPIRRLGSTNRLLSEISSSTNPDFDWVCHRSKRNKIPINPSR
tara:strand:- start:189 stop:494 length:306 start_codon:yes stop_codon:yes gene_type:complete